MRIVLNINPQTWVRIKSGKGGDHVYFCIPEVCIKGEEGEACEDYVRDGLCSHTLSKSGRARKRRLMKYNQYRLDLFHLAKLADFMLPSCGWALYFYIPVPKRWSKTKKAAMHGQLHMGKPDESNLLKAFEDALSINDEQVAQMSGLGKFWVNEPQGYIEILLNQPLYNPFGVDFISQHHKISMEDIEVRREKRKARKDELRRDKEAIKAAKDKAERKERKVRPLKLDQKALFKRKNRLI